MRSTPPPRQAPTRSVGEAQHDQIEFRRWQITEFGAEVMRRLQEAADSIGSIQD
jgi:hypothetical protein